MDLFASLHQRVLFVFQRKEFHNDMNISKFSGSEAIVQVTETFPPWHTFIVEYKQRKRLKERSFK